MRKSSLLLLIAVAAPAAGLLALGLRATGAEESRAALRAREVLAAAAETLAARVTALLREADLAADGYDPSAPSKSPLLAEVFVANSRGELLLPALERFPPAAPPDGEETAKLARYLDAAARELARTGDPLEAVPFLEPAITDFTHPDLLGRLLARLAELYRDGGRAERARYFFTEIARSLPGARGPDGEPLAVAAHLGLIELAEGSERASEVRALLARVADDAWSLAPLERKALLAAARDRLAPPVLPTEIETRARLVDALHSRVLPEAADRLAAEWRHLAWAAPDGAWVFGWRSITLAAGTHILGYRVSPDALLARLSAVAGDLAARHGARVEVATAPPVLAGAPPGSPVAIDTDLAGELDSVPVRILVPAPTGLGVLRWLHLSMTALLLSALLMAAGLSWRAMRREVDAAKVRQQFVDNVSHELRTPLTSIRMYAEMLAEEPALAPEERDRYAGWILRESERLSRLVEDVLDFSRVSRGESRFSLAPLSPAEVARAAIELTAPLAKESGFSLRSDVGEDLPAAMADRDAVLRILANLLSNAVRYAGNAREAWITGRAEGAAVLLTVADRGPGIPKEERQLLFTRFWRSPRDARKVRGVGLGLVLAREIARALGGELWLEEGDGPGSRFTLRLPRAQEGKP